jgi:hypothetical protein
MTTYQYAGNKPVMFNDPMGDKLNPQQLYYSDYYNVERSEGWGVPGGGGKELNRATLYAKNC